MWRTLRAGFLPAGKGKSAPIPYPREAANFPRVKNFTYTLNKILIFNNTPPLLKMLKHQPANQLHISEIIILIYYMHN
jgi:hypothetical protein